MKVITIGRSTDNDIIINDARVSRTHLQIVQNDNGIYSVVDLNSANGTFINGQKISGEVQLHQNDVVRIGNTSLPWQEYFKSPTVEKKSTNKVSQQQKANRMWLYIAVSLILILCICALGVYYYNHIRQENFDDTKHHEENLQTEHLSQEAQNKADEAKRLQDEADELFRRALISQSDKHKQLATEKQKEADEAKKLAKEAIEAQQKSEAARKIATEKAKAEEAKTKAKEAELEKEKRNFENNANKAIATANAETNLANEKANLTALFYEEYAVMDKEFAKDVCLQLGLQLEKHDVARSILKDLFNQGDNNKKQSIITAIQVVKRQNNKNKAKKDNKTKIKTDSVNSL